MNSLASSCDLETWIEFLYHAVELALTYRDCIERGSGECVISSKWQCKKNDKIIFVKHGGTCSEIIYNRIFISWAEMPWLTDKKCWLIRAFFFLCTKIKKLSKSIVRIAVFRPHKEGRGKYLKNFIEITPKRLISVPTWKVGGWIFEKLLENHRWNSDR